MATTEKPSPPRLADLPDILDAEQVAAVLQLPSADAVWRYCREGRIPHRKLGRLVRIPKAAFIKWLEEA